MLLDEWAGAFACIPSGCRPFFLTNSGGIACAQPPAKGFDASGIGTVTLPDFGY
jgi:hypothetical protein